VAAPAQSKADPPVGNYARIVCLLIGAWLGIALLKFGNPVVFEGMFPPPKDFTQILYLQWPAKWGFAGVAILALLAIPLFRFPKKVPKWIVLLPAIWLVWQWVATFDSIQPQLSRLTALHFTFVVAFFYLGLLATSGVGRSLFIWIGIGVGFLLVLSSGFNQQFGELEATAEFYEKLSRGEHPPEIQQEYDTPRFRAMWDTPLFRHKVQSKRVYSTLFYPNTLAGVLILLTPGLLAATWFGLKDASSLSRKILPTLLGIGSVLCLIWSGSKAGWLVAMIVVALVLLRSSIPPKWRKHVIIGFAVLGLAVLVGRNLEYFRKGAKSVGARTGYWIAAGQTFLDNPVTGAGPGTFGIYYAKLKPDDAEMARLAHNDYVQQASDSGAVGFLAYLVFIIGSLVLLYRSSAIQRQPIAFFIWVGLLGWGLQSATEFGLYIPAIAWPAFFLFGVLWRESANEIDSPETSR